MSISESNFLLHTVRYITLIDILTGMYTNTRLKENIRQIQKVETKMKERTNELHIQWPLPFEALV